MFFLLIGQPFIFSDVDSCPVINKTWFLTGYNFFLFLSLSVRYCLQCVIFIFLFSFFCCCSQMTLVVFLFFLPLQCLPQPSTKPSQWSSSCVKCWIFTTSTSSLGLSQTRTGSNSPKKSKVTSWVQIGLNWDSTNHSSSYKSKYLMVTLCIIHQV